MRIVRALTNRLLLCVAAVYSLAALPVFAAQVTLAWDANTENDIAGYKIYYSSAIQAPVSIDAGNAISATVSNLTDGVSYSFYATAYNTSGLESAPSSTLNFTTPGTPPASTTNSAPPVTDPPPSGPQTAPTIVSQPLSQTVAPGSTLQLSVSATGATPISYLWSHNFVPISGVTGPVVTIPSVQSSDAGYYIVIVSNAWGRVIGSASITVSQLASSGPSITVPPVAQNVNVGTALSLSVQASGSAPLQYQWFHDGVSILNATLPVLQLASAQLSDAGNYTVQVSNSGGTVTSSPVSVVVSSAPVLPTAPSIVTQPTGQTLAPGGSVNLAVAATGTAPLTYQWYRNGSPIANATGTTLQIASAQSADAGSYTVQVSNSAGSVTSSAAQLNLIYPPQITSAPVSQTVTAGTPVTLSVQVSGTGPMQFQWYHDNLPVSGGNDPTLQLGNVDNSANGSYTVTVLSAAGSDTSAPALLTVVVPPTITPPQIVAQPASQTLPPGGTLSLSVQASGSTPLQYQWFQNGTAISGANNPTYQFPFANYNNAGSYTVTVSNSAGAVTSAAALVSISGPPVITQQPQSQSVALGSALDISVQATGSGQIQYQWFRNQFAITSATGSTLHIAAVRSTDAGAYTVNVSNGSGSIASAPATITIIQPPTITAQPGNQLVITGASVSLSVGATGSGSLQYQWFHDGVAIPSATDPTLQIPSAQLSDAGNYLVKVSNSAGSVSSLTAVLNVTAPAVAPVISVQPLSQTIALGSSLTLSVGATGTAPLEYQWFRSGGAIAGATGATLPINAVRASDAGSYTVNVSNAAGSVSSSAAVVTVLTPPSIVLQPHDQALSTGAALSLSVGATGSEPLVYQWLRNGLEIPNATNATFQVPALQIGDAGAYSVRVSNAAGSAASGTANVSVTAPLSAPVITVQPQSQTIAANSALILQVQAQGSAPLSYQWFRGQVAIAGATGATFQLSSARTTDSGLYSVNVSNPAGSVSSSSAVVTIVTSPVITSQPSSRTVITGAAVIFSVTASGTGPLQFQWAHNGISIPNETKSTLSISPAQAADAGSYTVTVTNPGGSVTSSAAQLIVNAIQPPAIVVAPVAQTVAVGSVLSLSVSATGSDPLQYQWLRDGTPIADATNSIYSVQSCQQTNAGAYTVSVSNSAGTVQTDPVQIAVINPPVILTQPATQTLAAGATLNLSVEVLGGAPMSFQWFRNGSALPNGTNSSFQIVSAQSGDAGAYTVQITNAAGSVMSDPAQLSLVARPIITSQPANLSLPVGAPLSLNVQAIGSAPLQYQWFRNGVLIPTATFATLQIASIQTSDAGAYMVKVSNSAGSTTSDTATVRAIVAPAILTQPAAQTITSGSVLQLSVQASGSAPLSYQWCLGGVPLTNANSAVLTVPNATAADAGAYTVKVSNEAGTASSDPAGVTILVPPVITSISPSRSVAAGTGLDLNVLVTGTSPIQYQWLRNGVALANATSSTLHISSVRTTDGGLYTVRAANAAGVATSDPIVITVLTAPTIAAQSFSQTVVAGSSLTLFVQANGSGPLQYQWLHNGTLVSSGSSVLQIPSAQAADQGTYMAKVSNAAGSTTSYPVTVTVLTPPSINAQPTNQSVVLGAALTISVQASGSGPLQYQWFHNGDVIPEGTQPTLTLSSAGLADAGSYIVTVANAAGTETSDSAEVSVITPPVITTQPAAQAIPLAAPLLLSVEYSGSTPQFQWSRNGLPLSGATNSVLEIPAAQLTDNGSYTVTLTNAAGFVTSAPAAVQVLVPIGIIEQPLSQSASDGTTVTLSVEATGSEPLFYQWYRNGVALPGATASTLSFTASAGTAGSYHAAVSNQAGTLVSADAIVNVTPASEGTGGRGTISGSLGATEGKLVLRSAADSGLRMLATGTPGKIYTIQAATALPGDWSPVASVIASEDGVIDYTSADETAFPAKFYRVVLADQQISAPNVIRSPASR